METLAPAELSQYELERGKPMPSFNHGSIQLNIGSELKAHYRGQFRFSSEVNVDIDEGRIVVPDISVFPKVELNLAHDQIVVKKMPLTAIEILSPAQALDDLVDKTRLYFQAGVKSCWIVLPKLSGVLVYSNLNEYNYFHGKDRLRDPATGIELELAPFFE